MSDTDAEKLDDLNKILDDYARVIITMTNREQTMEEETQKAFKLFADERKERNKLHKALSQIASASPCVYKPGTPQERTCVLCETFINEARIALGFERWPAIPATKKEIK